MASLVTLKGGYVVPQSVLTTVMQALESVGKSNCEALCDLVQKCAQPGFDLGESEAILQEVGLIGTNDVMPCATFLKDTH